MKENKIWAGYTSLNGGRWMILPNNIEITSKGVKIDKLGNKLLNIPGVCWFSNVDHGRRHQPMILMTMEENLRHSKHKEIIENGYQKYDNYDAIEVPYVDAIPSDYNEEMGVPITFLDKYCPSQFEIIGLFNNSNLEEKNYMPYVPSTNSPYINKDGVEVLWNGPIVNKQAKYPRILIKKT